jgi:hypothetical protein
MKFHKIISLVAAMQLLFSSNVFAAENNDKSDLAFKNDSLKTTMEDNIKKQVNVLNMDDFSTNVQSKLKDKLNKFSNLKTLASATDPYTPDKYEPNNNSGVATSGIKNQVIQANLNSATDEDWYKIDITQSDLDANGGVAAALLTNIPNNCDYDLYILQILPNGQIAGLQSEQTGNSPEAIYFNCKPGTYYAVVDAKNGIENNFSQQNYSFYFGGAYKSGTTGYMDLGMRFNFGNNNYGSSGPWLSPYQEIDLSNASFIPNQALISKLYISDDSNGAYWIGFYKLVNGIEQMGGFQSPLPLAENQYAAKELYQVQGKITRSDGFIWQPKMRIDYLYPVTLDNLHFLLGQ